MQHNSSQRRMKLERFLWILSFIGSAILVWFLPKIYNIKVAGSVLGVGIFFDIASLFYHIISLVTKRRMSGFLVSYYFYLWFIIASNFSLVGIRETQIQRILLFKLVDATILIVFSLLCHLPSRFYKPGSNLDDR